jgi:hypothetical protein
VDEVGDEEDEERHGGTDEAYAGATADVFVVHIINKIKGAQHTCQEHHSQSEDEYPGVEQGVEAVGGVGPVGDHWRDFELRIES